MPNKLEQLKKMTTVVCDTGDIHSIEQYKPTDATTNPSLIYQAAKEEKYSHLLDDAIDFGMKKSKEQRLVLRYTMDKLFVNFGVEIVKLIPGRISTEVDARLSFDVEGSIQKATTLIDLYEAAGVERDRVLIKLASTWEGILAAKELEKDGIHCNMTLLFSLPQAIACAEAKATLISPFVGRILDWFKTNVKDATYTGETDPGVVSVRNIYNYYKKFDYKTEVMGASFRTVDEILSLAGCDLLTISPKFLEMLAKEEGTVERKLHTDQAHKLPIEKMQIDEKSFRYLMNDDAMAHEKLGDGIRKFAVDTLLLEKAILNRIEKRK